MTSQTFTSHEVTALKCLLDITGIYETKYVGKRNAEESQKCENWQLIKKKQ